ncbi:MAG: rhodanese-like domain-containing protein [Lactococcus chungangensis]|uniref:Rhodanese-related sulfurtransferase n=1 Tax=Pseudolactococcus chungangensis CAU 28 = DSM 22330 TaxID=1122154 RepID=A0A1K2HBF6_9LACT|nr:rhodanese-like domain-containing protein [Lactococcus chungangensis]MDD3016221.1 rhodanese-like domain-containing protein [Lactococcus chungangensis]PCS04932.1 hypothetical protein RR45_GL000251 [Lactococcus chungangensis CAU 28 = DSM 22330]SFZ74091.1 Rhodanese-related sulfurtransferase [Lactococcus chungangensis CAU 28 = DSM 22330]
MKNITAEELKTKLSDNIRVIDVREGYEYSNGHVPGAINIPMSEIEGRVSEIKEGDYIICQSGARSTNVCQWLEMQGLTITNVQGGTSSFRGVLEY